MNGIIADSGVRNRSAALAHSDLTGNVVHIENFIVGYGVANPLAKKRAGRSCSKHADSSQISATKELRGAGTEHADVGDGITVGINDLHRTAHVKWERRSN